MKSNLEQLTIDELGKIVETSKEEVRKERFKSVTGKLEDNKKIRELKKKIARANTIKHEYELGIRTKA